MGGELAAKSSWKSGQAFDPVRTKSRHSWRFKCCQFNSTSEQVRPREIAWEHLNSRQYLVNTPRSRSWATAVEYLEKLPGYHCQGVNDKSLMHCCSLEVFTCSLGGSNALSSSTFREHLTILSSSWVTMLDSSFTEGDSEKGQRWANTMIKCVL